MENDCSVAMHVLRQANIMGCVDTWPRLHSATSEWHFLVLIPSLLTVVDVVSSMQVESTSYRFTGEAVAESSSWLNAGS